MASNRSKIVQKEPFLHWIVTKCFIVRRNSLQLGGDFVVCKNSARAFLYISLPSLHDYDVKIPNFMFYGGRKQATTKCSFFFLNVSSVLKKSTPGKFAYIKHFQEIEINATKFQETRIHFKSDVFATVEVADAKVP